MEDWEYVLNLPEREINLETLYLRYEELLWKIANQELRIKEIKSNTILKPHKQNKQIEDLEYQERKITKMILIIEENRTNQHISNKFFNLNNKLKSEYKINNLNTTELVEYKEILHNTLKTIRKNIKHIKNNITKEFIQERVNGIKEKRMNNPNEFFKKAQPDNMFKSQQLWTVEYEKITKEKKEIITSSTPQVVQRKVKEVWEKIFNKSKIQTGFNHNVFVTKKFREISKKIKNKDQELVTNFTIEELSNVIRILSNGTAPGPDQIPNELIKILFKNEKFQLILLKVLNTCLCQRKMPHAWKKSHIFTIFKRIIQIIL